MALIKCPECGRTDVSDSAEACPNCGYGVKAHFEAIKEQKQKDQVEMAKNIAKLARKPQLKREEEYIPSHWDTENYSEE